MNCVALNMDCMEYMKTLPDKAFDLAVVDPPYGDALADESGGGVLEPLRRTLRPLQDGQTTCTAVAARERERDAADTDRERMCDSRTERGVTRVGGTWATKYAKKLLRGT